MAVIYAGALGHTLHGSQRDEWISRANFPDASHACKSFLQMKSLCTPLWVQFRTTITHAHTFFCCCWSAHFKIQGRSIFKGACAHTFSHTCKRKRDRRLKRAVSTVLIREQAGSLGKVNSLLGLAVMTVGYYAEDTLMMPCVMWQKVSREEGQACAFSLPA